MLARYPIVYGRIADYDTIDVARVLNEKKKELSSLNEMLNPFYSYQYSFHTEESIDFLSVNDKYYDITNGGMILW